MFDRERAKEILFRLVREAGDLECDTRLHKGFYYAHLWYHHLTGLFLTDWPIVRMPFGPGIDCGESLIRELRAEGRISRLPVRNGNDASWFVHLPISSTNRLRKDSGADAFQVKSVSEKRFVRRIGIVTSEQMEEIVSAVALCIGAP